MKLLFREENFKTQFKVLLGFVDHKGVEFKNIKADLISATKEVIQLVSKEIYELAYQYYTVVPPPPIDEDKAQLLYYLQYAIAVRAYSLYVPNNDVSHTGDGRKMRNEEHEKQAFEWMIDRDNQQLEKRYYRACDILLDYLDETPFLTNATPALNIWHETEAYQETTKTVIRTVKEFEEYFHIQSRLLFLRLVPGMKAAEREYVPVITRTVFETIKAKYHKKEFLTDKEEKTIDLIKQISTYYAMAWAVTRYNVTLFPEGVLQSYIGDRMSTQARKPSMMSDVDAAAEKFKISYMLALQDLTLLYQPVTSSTPDADIINYATFNTNEKFFTT
jgi:hypothetical protein